MGYESSDSKFLGSVPNFWERYNFTPVVYTIVAFFFFIVGRQWAAVSVFKALPWDSGWYYRIALDGYSFGGDYGIQSATAFAPGYPYFVKLFFWVFSSKNPLFLNIASLCLAIIASVFLYAAMKKICDVVYARFAVILFLFNPYSIYLFNGYSEASSAAAMAIFLWAFLSDRLYWAAAAISIGSLCRPQGVLLLIFFACLLGIKLLCDFKNRKVTDVEILQFVTQICIAATGFVFYISWQYFEFGDPLLFMHIRQTAWLSEPSNMAVYDLPGKINYSLRYIFDGLRSQDNGMTGLLGHLYFWISISISLLAFFVRGVAIRSLLILFAVVFPVLVFSLLVVARTEYELGRYSIGFVACYMVPLIFFSQKIPLMKPQKGIFWFNFISKISCVYATVGALFITYLSFRYFQGNWI